MQSWPTLTLEMLLSPTRTETFMWSKSATVTRTSSAFTESPFPAFTTLTVPSNSAVSKVPLARRISFAPSFTLSPAAT